MNYFEFDFEADLTKKIRDTWLLYKAGNSPKEISLLLGVGLKAVQSRLYRNVPARYILAFKPFTKKQGMILYYLSLNYSKKQIALELKITVSAVNQTIKLIEKKEKLKNNI